MWSQGMTFFPGTAAEFWVSDDQEDFLQRYKHSISASLTTVGTLLNYMANVTEELKF